VFRAIVIADSAIPRHRDHPFRSIAITFFAMAIADFGIVIARRGRLIDLAVRSVFREDGVREARHRDVRFPHPRASHGAHAD
jgi:hypothetical protein